MAFNFNELSTALEEAVAPYFDANEQAAIGPFIIEGVATTQLPTLVATFMGLIAGDVTVRRIIAQYVQTFIAGARVQQEATLLALDSTVAAQKAVAEAQLQASINLSSSLEAKFAQFAE